MTKRPAAGHSLSLNSFAAPFVKRSKAEGGQSSWPKYIEIVHLVGCESFNGRHNRYSDRFSPKENGDRSLALLNILKIFHSQLVKKPSYHYLRKTYLWLFDVLFEMSLSQKSHKLALKPRHRSLLFERLTMNAFCSPFGSLV